MNYTDIQLKQTLAKMLPDYGHAMISVDDETVTYHIYTPEGREILDTELLHLCWLVEETLTDDEWFVYEWFVFKNILRAYVPYSKAKGVTRTIHATWQQRTPALAKVKGIEIV